MILNLNFAKAHCGAVLHAEENVIINNDILKPMFDDCNECRVSLDYSYDGYRIECNGNCSIRLTGRCYRCGEKVDVDHCFEFNEMILPESLRQDDTNYCFKGDKVDITKIIEDNLILSLPLQLLCKNDCKGLCPHCYTNLNFSSCKCANTTSVSPFDVLRNIK